MEQGERGVGRESFPGSSRGAGTPSRALDAIRGAPALPLTARVAEEGEQLDAGLLQLVTAPGQPLVHFFRKASVRASSGFPVLGERDRVVVIAKLVMEPAGRVGRRIAELCAVHRWIPAAGHVRSTAARSPLPPSMMQSWGARTPRAARSSQTAAQASVLSLPRRESAPGLSGQLRCAPRTASAGAGLARPPSRTRR